MAREKTKKAEEVEIKPEKTGWAESYTSLLLGMVVVGIVGFIIFSFLRGGEEAKQTSSVADQEVAEEQEEEKEKVISKESKIYTVVAGDNLWIIAERQYKSGYNWVDIARENKLANSDLLYVGSKLVIPDVKPKTITVVQKDEKKPVANAIKGDSYTVVSGDHLWGIAVRAYSDGYKWIDIAKANKLENPDLIFAGNKLKIPR